MEEGFAVGLFCSDVKGAFDRVSAGRLTAKLAKTGLHADVVGFLASWLSDRTSKVVVGGRASGAEPLTDSVFQGRFSDHLSGAPSLQIPTGHSRRRALHLQRSLMI